MGPNQQQTSELKPARMPCNHNLLAISHLAALHEYGLTAAEACSAAGEIIAKAFAMISSSNNLQAKGIGDFVTEIDLQSNQVILEILKKETPQIIIISEEDLDHNFRREQPSWIVDPLDGTSAFHFKTNPKHPAVMIAMQNNLQIEIAIVYLPITEEWFFAVAGKGSFYYSKNEMEDLRTNNLSVDLQTSWVALNHYGDCQYETSFFNNLRSNLRTTDGAAMVTVEPPHSSIACRILLADGPVAVIHDNNSAKIKQEIWDIAPIKLIVENAGGVILQSNGNTYQLDSTGPIVIARNRNLAEKLIELGQKDPLRINVITDDHAEMTMIS